MYKLTNYNNIIRLIDSAVIPVNEDNKDYSTYLDWLAQGNTAEPADPIVVDNRALRASAYQAEADPLFFKAQRGECTQQDWLNKVAEIKARYP